MRPICLTILLLCLACASLTGSAHESDSLWIAAQQGDAHAQYQLGQNFRNGWNSYPRDINQARQWWRKAAEQEHLAAQSALGRSLIDNKDQALAEEGLRWLLLAADQGDIDAMGALAFFYAEQEDYQNAYYWYLLVSALGDFGSQNYRRNIQAYLLNDEIDAVRSLAEKWFSAFMLRVYNEHGW